VIDVPACDGTEGKGDDRCGDDDEFVVPRVWGLSPVVVRRFSSKCRRRRLIASNSSHMFVDDILPAGGDIGEIAFLRDA
jgi:hypothetical protein